MEKTVLCIRHGDSRQEYLAGFLKKRGYSTRLCEDIENESTDRYDWILFPVVTKGIDLEKEAIKLRSGQCVFGGTFPKEFLEQCRQKGAVCYEYMKEQSIAVRNAVATAEGAIAEALAAGQTNLCVGRSLVLGYGKCGKVLADRLYGMKSKVSVYEQDAVSRAEADTCGFSAIEDLSNMEQYSYIFNTIPKKLLREEELKKMQKDVVIIDIATGGGVDYDYCKKHGINAKLCPGLPGKYAPQTSAEILAEYIMKTGK